MMDLLCPHWQRRVPQIKLKSMWHLSMMAAPCYAENCVPADNSQPPCLRLRNRMGKTSRPDFEREGRDEDLMDGKAKRKEERGKKK